ncbi:MAG: hypothetical protein IJ794_14490 [Lachnospiraceae bacterium]|nr:hypothetical protein [Lachnospiraceae bacterium]
MWSFGSYETMLVIRFLSWPLLEWAAVKWVSKPYISAQRQLNMKWTLPAVTGWLFYITLYLMWSIPHVIILDTPAYLAALLLIMILMPLMYVVIFSSLIRQWKLNQSQQKELLLQTEMELLRSRIEQTSYTERQLSIQRHDLRHRFQALNTMIERGEYDAALNYIADSTHSLSETEIPHFCSESVLDAVFASYFHIAASKGIRINSELELPRELPHYLQTIRINISFPFFPYIY